MISKINTWTRECVSTFPLVIVRLNSFERNEQFASITPDFHRELRCSLLQQRLILSCGWLEFWGLNASCSWFYPVTSSSSGGWIQVTAESNSSGLIQLTADSSSGGWIRVTADSILRLARAPEPGSDLRLIPSNGWLKAAADSSSRSSIQVWPDSILRLRTSCGWFYPVADSRPPVGLDLQLTYTLIDQVNLRTYSVKYIFVVCFLPPDFSYHWLRLCLLVQEPWRSSKKLEEGWRSLKALAATDSRCSGWFELRRLIGDLRPIDYLQNFDLDAPWQDSYISFLIKN